MTRSLSRPAVEGCWPIGCLDDDASKMTAKFLTLLGPGWAHASRGAAIRRHALPKSPRKRRFAPAE